MISTTAHTAISQDIAVEPGLLLRRGATVFSIESMDDDNAILRHTVASDQRKAIRLSALLHQIAQGEVVPASLPDVARASDGDPFAEDDQIILAKLPLADLSQAQIDQVLTLMRYINALRQRGYTCLSPKNPTLQLDIDRLHRHLGKPDSVSPKASWIYSWSLKLNQQNGDPRALIPNYSARGGKGGKRTAPEVEAALQTILSRKREEPKAPIKTSKVLSDLRSLIQIEHPTRPDLIFEVNWSTIDRRIKQEFSAYDLCCRRYGKAHADRMFRDWYPRDRAEFPLAVWETDDTDTCVFTVDERSGLPAGRGYLTAVIDQHTQVIPGLELSEKPRSTWSAISALVNAMLPINPDAPEFAESKTGCEFFGKPGVVVFDNALYNHANEIELSAGSLGLIPGWAKAYTPTEKADQEGWNGRLKRDFLPELSGFRGDKKLRDGLKDGMASATMGMMEFRQVLMKWIYDDYCNTPLSDGLTARQRWHQGMRYVKPRIPRDVWGQKLVPCLHKTIKLRPEGVLFCGLIYSAPFLTALRKQYGHKCEALFRFNPGNLVEIYVQDPGTKAYVPVPSTDPGYTQGLSLYQHKLIRQLCRENKIRNPTGPQLLRHREELRVLTEQLRYSTKLKDRKRSHRTGDIPGQGASEAKTKPKEVLVAVTELEDTILHIEEVEMELDDDGWNMADTI